MAIYTSVSIMQRISEAQTIVVPRDNPMSARNLYHECPNWPQNSKSNDVEAFDRMVSVTS